MKIRSVHEVANAGTPAQFPVPELPEIAFVGRSNVGKSSLINHLVHRKRLARTSGTPGRTRRIYFYSVNEAILLVDLPGYGYTKVPIAVNRKWRQTIDIYLRGREALCGVVHLVDIRHPPSELDVRVSRWFRELELPVLTVAVKADKLGRNRQEQQVQLIRRDLDLPEKAPLLRYSVVTGEGRDGLWTRILSLCHPDQPETA